MMSEPLTATIQIAHPLGLHLRVGKDVVHVISQFCADITMQNLTRNSPMVDAKSILQLMQLQARQGHVLQIKAQGADAEAALDALRQLFAPDGLPSADVPPADMPPADVP